MSQEIPFEPFPFIDDPHQQTIISSFFNILIEPSSEQKLVRLADGDQLSVEVTTPKGWKESDLTVVMVHGLCGSHHSPYLVRMVKRLEPEGIRAVRINMRNAGSGKGLAKKTYHGGKSDDVFEVIKKLKSETPQSPMILIGFSIGGNIVLKLTGELGELAKRFLIATIAISPPVDLYSSVIMIGHPKNAIYENYFINLMREDVYYRHRRFKDLPRVRLPKKMKFYEFDQLYTAPSYGFRDARDYYNKCSSIQFVSDIQIPCRVLLSEDDPIVSPSSLDGCRSIEVFKTKKGGHMGYLANPAEGKGVYWLDGVLVNWVLEIKHSHVKDSKILS